MKGAFFSQYRIILKISFQNFSVVFKQGAQYCLISMIEKWKKSAYKGKAFAALLTDLSKAFHCLPHDLIIAKLNDYGFRLSTARLMQSYLCNRKQRTKINTTYSSWNEILYHIFSSLWENFSWKKSFLVISEILRPFVNTLTPDKKLFLCNRENLPTNTNAIL